MAISRRFRALIPPATAVVIGLAFSLASANALAQDAAPAIHGDMVAMDTDLDGRVSRREFAAAGGNSDAFAAHDGNGDGFISQAEMDVHQPGMDAKPKRGTGQPIPQPEISPNTPRA